MITEKLSASMKLNVIETEQIVRQFTRDMATSELNQYEIYIIVHVQFYSESGGFRKSMRLAPPLTQNLGDATVHTDITLIFLILVLIVSLMLSLL